MDKSYNRATEDVGNVIALEHVNLQHSDQRLATLFYMAGLGLTRDPYQMPGLENMWVNAGRCQFHLPTGEPQNLRGRTGLVLPNREALLRRLEKVKPQLQGTQFAFEAANDHVDAVSPWGHRVRCHEPDPDRFGRMALGIPYIEFDAPPGSAAGIARFYREIMLAPAETIVEEGAPAARVAVGTDQRLIFRETQASLPAYDGHHIQVYLADFSGPYEKLRARGLVTAENGRYQYRFRDIVDPESGKVLYAIEHEVRSMTHPLFGRPLVNRNAEQSNQAFAPGYETQSWAVGQPV